MNVDDLEREVYSAVDRLRKEMPSVDFGVEEKDYGSTFGILWKFGGGVYRHAVLIQRKTMIRPPTIEHVIIPHDGPIDEDEEYVSFHGRTYRVDARVIKEGEWKANEVSSEEIVDGVRRWFSRTVHMGEAARLALANA